MEKQFTAKLILVILLLIGGISHPRAQAQKLISGTISDAETAQTLPSANILIEGTYRGTISNENGDYLLSIPDSLLPATILVRYIGYRTQEKTVNAGSDEQYDFLLKPAVAEMEEITVTGENPAVRIMREVIERKRKWRRALNTYQADAYTRQTLANDTSIVSITESVSKVYWDEEKGHREVLMSKRQTANIPSAQNFAGVSYLPNFYDDNVEIAGFDLIGVTHPKALSYYDFKLINSTSIDEQTVYEIKVIPARKFQPLFEGTVHVLEEEFALLGVDLCPNDVVNFPLPVQSFTTSYQQQFNNFGKAFWLPVDVRINGDIKISLPGLNFPLIKFKQISRITNYNVNTNLPDSLYKQDDLFSVDSTTVTSDSLIHTQMVEIPLSAREEEAYAIVDSTATLEKAFKPSGFLARFMDDENDIGPADSGFINKIPGSITPAGRFNRVDEVFLGLKYSVSATDRLQLRVNGGYSTGYRKWSYGGGFAFDWLAQGSFKSSIGGDYSAGTSPRYSSNIYKPFYTIIPNLLGNNGYFDYFRSEGFRVFSKWQYPSKQLSLTIAFNHQDQSSLITNTAYDILGKSDNFRINPPINEGLMQSVDFVAGYNLDERYNFGITGRKYIRFEVEHSSKALGSDFVFTRYETRLAWEFPTFFKRRLFPNTMDVGLKTGTFSGDLPFQKMGIIDGALGILSPYGILRAGRGTPYQGEQYAALHLEHNFQSVPFEILGLESLVDRSIGLILFGGAAKTWGAGRTEQEIAETGYSSNVTPNIHWEAGLSINRILGFLRLDFAARIDQPAFLVNVGVARLF